MKKNLLYALVACLAFTFVACSDDPMDATSKHVYGPEENPYLKTDLTATISTSLEFPVQRIDVPQEIKLADYAETFQAQLGMTVDEVVNGLSSGSVVFCPINVTRGQWLRNAAPTKGTHGWHFNSAGGLCEASSAMYSVEFDASKKAVVVTCNSNTAAGVYSFNVGFAIDNGENFDDYVRISNSISVTDPSKIVLTKSFDASAEAFTGFSINFADHKDAIEVCMGMPLAEFSAAVVASGDARYDETLTPTLAMYPVKADGTWDTASAYTANGLGYWFDINSNVVGWSSACVYFAESGDGSVNFGRYYDIPVGTQVKIHFVYTVINDPSRYIEFVISATM